MKIFALKGNNTIKQMKYKAGESKCEKSLLITVLIEERRKT